MAKRTVTAVRTRTGMNQSMWKNVRLASAVESTVGTTQVGISCEMPVASGDWV